MNAPKSTLCLLVIAALAQSVAAQDKDKFAEIPAAPPLGQPRQPLIINPTIGAPGWRFNPDPFGTNSNFNPVRVIPVNPLLPNPYFANPLTKNPVSDPFNNPLTNPYGIANPFAKGPQPPNPYAPIVVAQPAIAVQQPGFLRWMGPDTFVNPVAGTVVKPIAGVAQTADGATFYRLDRAGGPAAFTGGPRTGIYFDPKNGTYYDPYTGVILKPGGVNVFLPWMR